MEHVSKYNSILENIFKKAFESDSIHFIYTILRVGGMSDSNWDPFEESRNFFEDYNWMLEKLVEKDENVSISRLALLAYCQGIEMSAIHEILTNLLRCISGETYHIQPLDHLGRRKKKDIFYFVPPSAKTKYNHIKKIATELALNELAITIDEIYSDDIRNSFSHSDYVITEEYFRYSKNKTRQQMPINELHGYINSCIDFVSTFMYLHRKWLHELSAVPKYHKWSNYEVFEIICENKSVCGFSVHFSNGSKATYKRTKEGTEATNITFDQDGSVNFFVGRTDKLEKEWKVDGKLHNF